MLHQLCLLAEHGHMTFDVHAQDAIMLQMLLDKIIFGVIALLPIGPTKRCQTKKERNTFYLDSCQGSPQTCDPFACRHQQHRRTQKADPDTQTDSRDTKHTKQLPQMTHIQISLVHVLLRSIQAEKHHMLMLGRQVLQELLRTNAVHKALSHILQNAELLVHVLNLRVACSRCLTCSAYKPFIRIARQNRSLGGHLSASSSSYHS